MRVIVGTALTFIALGLPAILLSDIPAINDSLVAPFVYGAILVLIEVIVILREGANPYGTKTTYIQFISSALSLHAVLAFTKGFAMAMGASRGNDSPWYLYAIAFALALLAALLPLFAAAKRYEKRHPGYKPL